MPTLRANANIGVATWSDGVPTTGATAISAARIVSADDSGGIFVITQSGVAPFAITLPTPVAGSEGMSYVFVLGAAAAQSVTVVAAGCTFVGTVVDATPGAAAAAGATVTFVGGLGVVGDWIEVTSTSAITYNIRAVTSALAGITVV